VLTVIVSPKRPSHDHRVIVIDDHPDDLANSHQPFLLGDA
jgi:hypothetical protein